MLLGNAVADCWTSYNCGLKAALGWKWQGSARRFIIAGSRWHWVANGSAVQIAKGLATVGSRWQWVAGWYRFQVERKQRFS